MYWLSALEKTAAIFKTNCRNIPERFEIKSFTWVLGMVDARGWRSVLLLMGLDDSSPRRTMLSSSGRRAQFLLLDPCCVPGTGSCSNYELCCAAPLVDQLYNAFLIGSPPRFFIATSEPRRGRGPVTDPCLRAGHPWATVPAGQVLAAWGRTFKVWSVYLNKSTYLIHRCSLGFLLTTLSEEYSDLNCTKITY